MATDPKTGLPMIVMGEFDITSRKRLETAQLLSKRQLEVVIEGLEVGLLLEDENRRVIVANQAFCDIFAIETPPESLVGMGGVDLLLHGEHRCHRLQVV